MNPNLDTFDDTDLWQMATEARLDRGSPLDDDLESALSLYHRKMAEFALAHHEEKQKIMQQRQCYAFVLINGQAVDPELELRLAELEGMKEQAIQQMKKIHACYAASVLLHHLS